jgi:hypothetical protein
MLVNPVKAEAAQFNPDHIAVDTIARSRLVASKLCDWVDAGRRVDLLSDRSAL